MRDIIFAFILIAATIGLIWLIRIMSADFRGSCRRPRVELRVFFDQNCECLEYSLDRIYSSVALRETDLRVVIVDCVATEESRQWLKALSVKLKKDFEIIAEDESGGTAEYCDDKGNG